MSLPPITSVMLVLTHACNLRCRYCFVEKQPEYMTYETALDAVHFLVENSKISNVNPSINFFGGEPMIMWDKIIEPLTTYIRKEYGNLFGISLTTNGTLLTEERLQFMRDHRIGFLLSVDGGKETQDYNRPKVSGEGSFDEVSKWFAPLLGLQPNATFRMTSIPKTCHRLFEDIMFAEQTGFKNFFTVPNVFEQWNDEAKDALREQVDLYTDYYIAMYRQGKNPIKFNTLEDTFKEINLINQAGRTGAFRTLRSCQACGKCGLGASRFASIHPNGDVFGCQEMTSNAGADSIFYIGNIHSGIENDRRQVLMDMYDSQVSKGDDCEKCLYNNICDGGCVANNYMITGSLSQLPEMYCWWKRLILSSAIRIMQTLGTEENELFREKWRAACRK